MNKNIKTEIAVGIILIISILIGGLVWLGNKNQQIEDKNQVPVTSNKNNVDDQNNISDAISNQDSVLIHRNTDYGIYEINLITKELKPYNNPVANLAKFTGLPKEIENKQISISNRVDILSQDKSKAIVVSITSDKTKEPSEFDGSLPILKASEFVCDTLSKKCSPTDYLASAYRGIGLQGNWYEYSSVWWLNWDVTKNVLYGHLTGEGVGNASPIYTFNLDTKKLQQTTGYDALNEKEKEKRAEVPAGAFSPSLSKFIMIDENWNNNVSSNKWDLLLYDINNLSAPLKKFDISAINNKTNGDGRVNSVAWSADEKTLVLETSKQIYTLNLDNGKIYLRYTDTIRDDSGLWLDFNAIALSQSGRYIVFVDYDKRNTSRDENKMNTVLKAIDLKDSNKVIELLREEGITLNYWF